MCEKASENVCVLACHFDLMACKARSRGAARKLFQVCNHQRLIETVHEMFQTVFTLTLCLSAAVLVAMIPVGIIATKTATDTQMVMTLCVCEIGLFGMFYFVSC